VRRLRLRLLVQLEACKTLQHIHAIIIIHPS
jgi:hypothetical protein